ncbi:alpha/beta fold hydrolase [Microbacterium hominis]|uniref:Alpha/beta fold hydrolase n=1 Tax=Microbacterium hominis TaxID=162426 RepID=A0A7D4TQS7_9MICO|nr:alpha/beta fold hydrolase [Microbacterium hominis]QKJ19344.1 alpha/beta fold hydrolase [Microbacterium hominis]
MLAEDPVVRRARFGGDDVAWAAVGSGPGVLLGGWWSSHLVHDLAVPEFRGFLARLAAHWTVIRFDPIGVGLSRRAAGVEGDVTAHAAAMAAVIEDAVDAPVSVVTGSSGAPVAVALAALRPDLLDRLVVCGGYLRGRDIAGAEDREAMVELVRRNWGITSRVLAEVFLPGGSSVQRQEFARFQRRIASAEEAAAALASVYELDATPFASAVRAPTLVLHRRDDRAIRFSLGRDLAERIPGARFEPIAGIDHFPWFGDVDEVIGHLEDFLDLPRSPHASSRAGDGPRHTVARAGLTPRETEILALVAEGLTDAQIADRLFLSPHTIHRHVANARTKLGVPTRAAAAALVIAADQPG